jgi:putative flippase GtrA
MKYLFFDIKKTSCQAIRFGIVGGGSNILLYFLYLFLTLQGVGHKAAMTLLFTIGFVQTFFFNRLWTFENQETFRSTFAKYFLAYFFAYIINLTALYVFSDYFGYRHQIIQGLMIFIVAIFLFIIQRCWVFQGSASFRSQSSVK